MAVAVKEKQTEQFETAAELYRVAYAKFGPTGDEGLAFIKRHLRTTLRRKGGPEAIEAAFEYGIRKILWDMGHEERKRFKRPGDFEAKPDNTPRGGRGVVTGGFEYSKILDMVLEGQRLGEFTLEDCKHFGGKYRADSEEKARMSELMEWGAGKLKGKPEDATLEMVVTDAAAEKARARIFDE